MDRVSCYGRFPYGVESFADCGGGSAAGLHSDTGASLVLGGGSRGRFSPAEEVITRAGGFGAGKSYCGRGGGDGFGGGRGGTGAVISIVVHGVGDVGLVVFEVRDSVGFAELGDVHGDIIGADAIGWGSTRDDRDIPLALSNGGIGASGAADIHGDSADVHVGLK